MGNNTDDYGFNITGMGPNLEYALWGWWVQQVLTPIIVLVGLVGNTMSFAVMKSKALRDKSYSHYLCALAVFDSLTLIGREVDVVNGLIMYFGNSSIFSNFTHGTCKLYNFCEHLCYLMSSWLLVAMAMERIVAVFFPFKKTSVCNQRVGVSLILTLVILLSISQLFRPLMIIHDEVCRADLEFNLIYTQLHTYFYQLSLIFTLPAFLILLCNGLILWKIHEIRKATDNYSDAICTTTTTTRLTHSRTRQHKTTFMLLVISFSYVIFTFPLIVLTIVILIKSTPGDIAAAMFLISLKPYGDVLVVLSEVSYGINFFIYVISGKSFRRELRKLFVGDPHPTFSSVRTKDTNSRLNP